MATAGLNPNAKEKWLALLGDALRDSSLIKVTLSSFAGADQTLKNVFIRPVLVQAGPRLSFVYRHATRDITRNLEHEAGVSRISEMLGAEFLNAHLFTTRLSGQLKFRRGREPSMVLGPPSHTAPASTRHDRDKQRIVPLAGARWLQALGLATADGRVAKGMEAKFRQIHKFTELLGHLLLEAGLHPSRPVGEEDRLRPSASSGTLTLVDMGCGKGYLTFAAYESLRFAGWSEVMVRGIEARSELVKLGNATAQESGLAGLHFEAGDIAGATLDQVNVLVALHACDTATDDALAKGVHAGASLILVSPCCHQELRPQLRAPEVLKGALQHGILRERQAEFVTDALRAALLEWAGYDTKIFEFISTEHTSKNLMIAAIKKTRADDRLHREGQVRNLADFYGIRSQRLATHLGLSLTAEKA